MIFTTRPFFQPALSICNSPFYFVTRAFRLLNSNLQHVSRSFIFLNEQFATRNSQISFLEYQLATNNSHIIKLHIYQIDLLQVLIFMQRVKKWNLLGYFFTYFQPISYVYETRKHNFKQPDAFSKYIKFSISYRSLKLWRINLAMAEKLLSVITISNEVKRKAFVRRKWIKLLSFAFYICKRLVFKIKFQILSFYQFT